MRHLAPPTLPSQIPRFVIKAAIGSRSGSHFPPGNSVWARSGSWRFWLASYRRLNRKKAASLGVNSRQMLPSTTETDSGVTVKGAKVTRSADSLELLLPGARLPSGQRRLQNPPAKSKFLAEKRPLQKARGVGRSSSVKTCPSRWSSLRQDGRSRTGADQG